MHRAFSDRPARLRSVVRNLFSSIVFMSIVTTVVKPIILARVFRDSPRA